MPPMETRILPLPRSKAAHAIVSMPADSWFWLDELVKTTYPRGGYKALIRAFEDKAACPETLSAALRCRAQLHQQEQLAVFYRLSNDNAAKSHIRLKPLLSLPDQPAYPESRMPFAYQLFRFLAHPTHLTTVWQRRHYSAERGGSDST